MARAIAFGIGIKNPVALKGHGFSRAVRIRKIDGALAPGGCILLLPKTIPQGLKPESFSFDCFGTAKAVPFQGILFRILKCDCPAAAIRRTPLSALGVYWRGAGKAEGESRRKGVRS